jgi:hypothetical protein
MISYESKYKSKYRGTQIYHIIFHELMTAAKYRGTLTYQEIASLMNLPLTGSHMSKEVGQILGEISEDEHLNNRPMLSAIAVGVKGEPGEGFFDLAKTLGKAFDEDKEGKQIFWQNECKAVYDTWKTMLE